MAILTIILGLLLIGFAFLYRHLTQNRGVIESFGIPYIKPLFVFGSPPYFYHRISIREWTVKQFEKFGKTWARYEGITPTIVTIDPEFIKQVTVKQFDNFTDAFDFQTDDDHTTLDIAKGDVWRALRKMLSPTFTTGKLKGMLEPMEGIADKTIDFIEEQAKLSPQFNIKPILQGFTLDTISKCGFGLDTNAHKGDNSDFAKNAYAVFDQLRADNWMDSIIYTASSHFPVILKMLGFWSEPALKVKELTRDIMNQRDKLNIHEGDFIDRLREHKLNLEPPVTPGMIEAQGIVFLTAGFETTANTLGHMVYMLAKNPEVQERLYEEILSVCGDSSINHENIKEMHLLEATMCETLRIRPALTEHDRICTNDTEVLGIKIPKGTRIQMPNYPSHINEEFFPEPFAFKPERFLKENNNDLIPFTWRAFGSGNRVCIGQRFATVEILIFMSKLLAKFKIVDTPETVTKYYNGDFFANIFHEMVVRLEPRE
uniref:Cytochrome P450 3027F1 n=1 Tax=Paracyclopina nana TaxID=565004 RepID=A0A0F7IZY5_PARNA|nr:cytochrome P450 3027F1 [Paracyclopina nana]